MAEVGEPTANRAMAGPLLSIGVFARRSRLSPKALRLYERLGLLPPAHVAPDSGYRWYRADQLAAARLVALLRRLDMPLAQISAVISAPGTVGAALVAAHWAAQEERIAGQRTLATYLRDKLSGQEGGSTMFDIHERDVPEQFVLTEQRHVPVGELPGWIEAAMGRLLHAAGAHGGMIAPAFVIYHGEVNEDSDGPVEVCLPIGQPTESATGLPTRREPAHHEAYTRITKAQVVYPQILAAYDAVAAWVVAQGRTIDGSPREVYFTNLDAATPTEEACDIAFPLR